MNFTISNNYTRSKSKIHDIIKNFKNEGILIGDGGRNIIKHVSVNGKRLNFKSFKKPNPINRIAYKYLRKSKARRSFEYAHLLISKNFNTPQPIAFVEFDNFFGLTSSYYICEHLDNVLTLREIYANPKFEDRETIIKKYTYLMHQLHESGIEFIDNTSANFLIKKEKNDYMFFIVDLNRMSFHNKISYGKRLRNISKTTNDGNLIKIISAEYARLTNLPEDFCYRKITQYSKIRQFKHKLKNKLKFYKSIKMKPYTLNQMIDGMQNFLVS